MNTFNNPRDDPGDDAPVAAPGDEHGEHVQQVFTQEVNTDNSMGKPNTGDGDSRVRMFGDSGNPDDEEKAMVAERLRFSSDDLGMEF